MRKFLAIFALLALVGAAGLYAQETTAEVTGVVADEEGTALPGATVEAVSPSLIGKATAISDAAGRYRLRALVPGTYKVTFMLQGFATKIQENVLLRTGQVLTLNMRMTQAALEETVTVTAASPLIDVKRSSTATNITKEVFSRLPVGRNFTNLVTLAPSVNNEAWLGGISVDGASGSENMFFVDGTDITDMYTGGNTLNVRLEHLEEVQVKQSGYEAEFGGSMGGVINVITRSGGNEFHGEATFYIDGSTFDGTPRESLRLNPLDSTQYEYYNPGEKRSPGLWNRYEFGLNIGGYVMKDKLWFYGGFMPTIMKQDRETIFIIGGVTKTFDRTQYWPRMQAKITAQPLSNLRLSASYANDTWKWSHLLPADSDPPENDPLAAFSTYDEFGRYTPDMTFSFRADYIANPNLFFSGTAGYYYTNQGIGSSFSTDKNIYRMVASNMTLASGAWATYPTELRRPGGWWSYPSGEMWNTQKNEQTRLGVTADATYYLDLAGEHAWKVGFQFAQIRQDVNELSWGDYLLLYPNRTYYDHNGGANKGTYGYFQVRGTGPQDYGTRAKIHSNRYALYIQDSWTIGKKLTLNFGLRAEQESIPSMATATEAAEYGVPENFTPIKFNFTDKLAPRLGLSYDLFGDSSLKIFASWGIFYDVMKLEMAEGSFGGFAWKSQYYKWESPDWSQLTYPYTAGGNVFIEEMDWRIPSWDTVEEGLKPMSQVEYVLGAEKQMWENFSFKVRGVYKHLIRTIEDVGIMTDLGEMYYIANPGSDWVNSKLDPNYLPCPTAKRDYYAADFAVEKRYSQNWLGGFSYTWSRLWGNYSGLASSDEFGRMSPNVNRYFDLWFLSYDQQGKETVGLLPTDRTHQLKLWGSYVLPFGLTVGLNAIAMSGTPVTTEFYQGGVQGYYPLNRGFYMDGFGGPIVEGKRTPFLYRMDLFVQYDLKLFGKYTLQFNANVTNIFNFKIAQRVFSTVNQTNIYMDDDDLLAGYDFWQVIQTNNLTLDPRYGQNTTFTAPWAARLGVKFIF